MSESSVNRGHGETQVLGKVEREIGRHSGRSGSRTADDIVGKSLVVVAGIHGNEPAGVHAARRVLARLDSGAIDVAGELVVLAGNVHGLNHGVRYVDRDLNRGWTNEGVRALQARDRESLHNEDREQRELIEAIDDAVARAHARAAARGEAATVVLADLHTSSAPGVPFVLYGQKAAQREFVRVFPVPVISGIVDKVAGVLAEFVCARGTETTFSAEGGQHDDPSSVDALEAVLWLSLARAGMIDAGLTEVGKSHAVLEQLRGDLPKMVDVVSRRAITPADDFVMERGFRNVDRIKKGQLLAKDARGEVRAEEDGVVVLPLYQKLGSDGFFWGKEIR